MDFFLQTEFEESYDSYAFTDRLYNFHPKPKLIKVLKKPCNYLKILGMYLPARRNFFLGILYAYFMQTVFEAKRLSNKFVNSTCYILINGKQLRKHDYFVILLYFRNKILIEDLICRYLKHICTS